MHRDTLTITLRQVGAKTSSGIKSDNDFNHFLKKDLYEIAHFIFTRYSQSLPPEATPLEDFATFWMFSTQAIICLQRYSIEVILEIKDTKSWSGT